MALGASYSCIPIPQSGPTRTTITRENVTMVNGEHPTRNHLYADCYYEPDNPDSICPGDNNPPILPPPPPPVCGLPGLSCQQGGYPRGRIRVKDTQLGICEPVADVQIRSKNWFRIKSTRTNALGEFFINVITQALRRGKG